MDCVCLRRAGSWPATWPARPARRTSPATAASWSSWCRRSRRPTTGTARRPSALIHPIAPHYNTLLRVDPIDRTGTKPVGDLAESLDDLARTGSTYTFKLRQGVKFHDGSRDDLEGRQGVLRQDHLPARRASSSSRKGQYSVGRGGRGAGSVHGALPPQVARGLVPPRTSPRRGTGSTRRTSWPRTCTGTRRTSWAPGPSSSSST